MPEYLHPGVYIEETSYRGKPIQGVSTSTAGFVGAARKGAEGRAIFIPSFADFRRTFGDPITAPAGLGDYLGHAVKAFYDNGGSRCYVVRTLAADALASNVAVEQGIALKLATGVTVRGPTRTIRLSALRGVGAGSVLRIFTRPNATSPFAETRTATVESYDATRNSVTVVAADEIPSGVVLEPANTVVLINGAAPAAVAAIGGGPTFTARNRGADGDRIAVEIRPRDRPPVALTSVSGNRQDPLIDLAPAGFPLAAAQTTLEFTAPALRRLRTGDEITVGASTGLVVQAIADGDVTFDVVGGGPGANHSAGPGTIQLIERGGTALGTPLDLGVAPAAFAIDMTVAGPYGPTALAHDVAMLLRNGDVVRVDTGGVTTDVGIGVVQVAEEIAPGQHVTVAPGLGAAEAGPTEARITATSGLDPAMTRIFLADVSRFAVPQRAGAAEVISISDGANRDPGRILLVDPANNVLYIATAPNEFPTNVALDAWLSAEGLQVAGDNDDTVRVSSTASFYTGAKVELDTGTAKIERVVQSIDIAARTVTFTAPLALGPGNFIDLDPDPAARRVYLRTCEIDIVVYENNIVAEAFDGLTWNPDPVTDAGLRYYAARLNDSEVGSRLVQVTAPAGPMPPDLPFAQAPANANGQPKWLTNGSNGSALTDIDLIGADNGPGRRTGIQALAERDDIAMVAVPGVTLETVQAALITHCELLKYRVAVLDSPPTALDVVALQSHRFNYDSKYAAYYAPWLRALNTFNGRIESFPPSAYAMGIFARSDNTVGVHKAPANEVVRNIVDVALPFTAAEQDVLNPVGINLIRDLTPRGIRLWGARTISSDQEWKYLNFRRLFIYLEHSIDLGTQRVQTV